MGAEVWLAFAVGWCAHWLGTYLAHRQPYQWTCEHCPMKIKATHQQSLTIAIKHHMRDHAHADQ